MGNAPIPRVGMPWSLASGSWVVFALSIVGTHPRGISASPNLLPKPNHSCLVHGVCSGRARGLSLLPPSLGAGGVARGSQAGDSNWGLVTTVVMLSLFPPPQASAFPLKVSVTPRAGGCIRPAVLVLLCARCSAIVTSPCADLLIRTVSDTAPCLEQPRG